MEERGGEPVLWRQRRALAVLGLLGVTLCLIGSWGPLWQDAAPAAAQEQTQEQTQEEDFIRWVDFDVTYQAMNDALQADLQHYQQGNPLDWVTLLSCLATRYGGDFSQYQKADLDALVQQWEQGASWESLSGHAGNFAYYQEAYRAVLGEFVGVYWTQDSDGQWRQMYGLKVFSPIAKTFPFQHFDDFGNSRTYGYQRRHLGHDMMGQVGTPIVAIESGVVEVMGWNQYGGWRIGIRSFDGKRYYYYAHLRQNRPYHETLYEGKVVTAGEVIGYLGRTGYSANENVNNIKTSHLHVGMELIFDESQKESDQEIWIDLYAITRLLEQHKSAVYRVDETKEFYRQHEMIDLTNGEATAEDEAEPSGDSGQHSA